MISAGSWGESSTSILPAQSGQARGEENILWSFAPHDISAVLYLLEEMPTRVPAWVGTYVDSRGRGHHAEHLSVSSGVNVHIFVSWLHPFKEQKLTIVGGKKMVVFDDMDLSACMLYSHRIDWVDRMRFFFFAHKDDDNWCPFRRMSLCCVSASTFWSACGKSANPRTDAAGALQVLEVLDACERSLRHGGAL